MAEQPERLIDQTDRGAAGEGGQRQWASQHGATQQRSSHFGGPPDGQAAIVVQVD
jgi:hypothetical protein